MKSLEVVDLTRRMGAYDGCLGDEDWDCPIQVPMGISRWNFTIAEIDRQDFRQLKAELGEQNFKTIVDTQGYVYPDDESSCYRGNNDLPLYSIVRTVLGQGGEESYPKLKVQSYN